MNIQKQFYSEALNTEYIFRVRLYWSESETERTLTSVLVQRESNLMFTLNSGKDKKISLSHSLLLSVNGPIIMSSWK